MTCRHLSRRCLILFRTSSGERGIRTPGTSQYNGFQDRRDRPLCHLSCFLRCKGNTLFEIRKIYFKKFDKFFLNSSSNSCMGLKMRIKSLFLPGFVLCDNPKLLA